MREDEAIEKLHGLTRNGTRFLSMELGPNINNGVGTSVSFADIQLQYSERKANGKAL